MNRAYYSDSLKEFLKQDKKIIFGEIVSNDQFSAQDLQKNTWQSEIEILKRELSYFESGHVLFEYTIPRIGKRIDSIFIHRGIIFLLEFKVGERNYPSYAIEQVTDYALDLNSFHKESHDKLLVPILVSTEATEKYQEIKEIRKNVLETYCCNELNIHNYIQEITKKYSEKEFEPIDWVNSVYMPTPTIIEAAQVLYNDHNVEDISRNDASAINLNKTTEEINKIIDNSKKNKRKSICFITGVPGAGKTLAGLNIAIERQKIDEEEHAVFLSGNGPLVDVLREALARDDHERNKISKKESLRKAEEFIQKIHHFRDDAISIDKAPFEKVVIFDEAQRAWDKENLKDFMKRKKGIVNFEVSEPDFLISILDRHEDWAVIICLVGGGQEINKGESEGIAGWFEAIREKYKHWDVYISDKIIEEEYLKGQNFDNLVKNISYIKKENLHLSVSLRSFRSEKVSNFIKLLLDNNPQSARELYKEIRKDYPIFLTRDLNIAKAWIKEKARGTERYGMIASSGAKRLRKYGVWVQNKVEAEKWFLNSKNDIRSSYFLEETATEFDIQGLELDWTIVCWDANLRYDEDFEYYNFTGDSWKNINKDEIRTYLKNTYRVLLTRSRQGFIIFVPEGNSEDETMQPKFYDGVYDYLKEIGLEEI
ncbi:hypothetical protein CTM86_09965 [Fusobacterium pseudoperiodonticum]|uniref:AAA+ ATPase domain-containing protein n=1 Tax=Fusobacterium pseudoperiodonticum TaxID=2663009 RepID=A0AAD0F4P4_9FUSO|nr:DUF2075 domain-containing protein [Fusobacterium pseudoperiodonticum]ATV66865.1 hypothetical protein CTM86_09965 [Fusobacterium pseudoperiodonticum]